MHNPSKDKVEEAAHDYESTGTMIAKSLRQQKLIFQEKNGLVEFDKHIWQKHTISMHTDTRRCNTHTNRLTHTREREREREREQMPADAKKMSCKKKKSDATHSTQLVYFVTISVTVTRSSDEFHKKSDNSYRSRQNEQVNKIIAWLAVSCSVVHKCTSWKQESRA